MTPNTKSLNTVKFLAGCIIAFGWHYQHFGTTYVSFISPALSWCFNSGWLAVEIFFALSGFGMYVGYKERIQKRQISFYDYLSKRVVKIYPLFLISLLLVTALQFLHIAITGETFIYENFDLLHFFMNLFLCQNGLFSTDLSFNGVAWNVTVNFLLYILFFIGARLSKKYNLSGVVFGVLYIFALYIWYWRINYPYLANLQVARGIICFAQGMFVAAYYQKKKTVNTTIIGYASLLIFIIYCCLYIWGNKAVSDFTLFYVFSVPVFLILSVLYIPWLNALLSSKILQFPASLSFEVYLFHFPMQCVMRIVDLKFNLNLDYTSPLIWIMYVSLVIIISSVYKKLLSERITAFAARIADRLGKIEVPIKA